MCNLERGKLWKWGISLQKYLGRFTPSKKIKSSVKERNLSFVHLSWEVFSQGFSFLQLWSTENCSENRLLKCDPPSPIVYLHLTYEFTLIFLMSSLISIVNHEKVLVVLKSTVFEFMLLKHTVSHKVCFFYSPVLLYRGCERGLKRIFNNIFRNLVALDKKHSCSM